MDLESLTLKAKNAEEELHEVEGELEKVLLDAAAATRKSEEASATSNNALNESKAAMVNAARSMEEASNAKTEAEKLRSQSEEVQAELHSTTKALDEAAQRLSILKEEVAATEKKKVSLESAVAQANADVDAIAKLAEQHQARAATARNSADHLREECDALVSSLR